MKLISVQDLKITTLAENSATSILLGQWGLSFLLEMTDAKGKKRKIVLGLTPMLGLSGLLNLTAAV